MIREALSFIDPADRETWLMCCFAVKSALGDEGFEIWNEWSQGAASYNEASARSTWKSAKREGRITVGSLYLLAKRNGWNPQNPILLERPKPTVPRKDESKAIGARRAKAARIAQSMIDEAVTQEHPYLERKGFPKQTGLVWRELLLVPMRDMNGNTLNSVQTITESGTKKFLFGGKAGGSVFVIGAGAEAYLCEGYATGLSVQAALRLLYRQVRVVVCFSAANMAHVAGKIKGVVVADHDASGTGQKYAEKSGLPWWMPPGVGQDANDYMLAHGVRALADCLNDLRRSVQGGSRQGRKTQTGRPHATALG